MTDLTAISLGAGVQSTALYMLAIHGKIEPMPNVAIFADTMQEPHWVYENVTELSRRGQLKIPVRTATVGDLGEAIKKGINTTGGRFASVPFWAMGSDGREAPGRRQCTREYKVDVVTREIRTLLGLKKGQWAKGRFKVEQWIGISTDEAHRAKPSRDEWITARWPLLELGMNRQDCKNYLEGIGYPIPQKSACVFCPYRTAAEYARWREEHPELFEEACKWDDAIRSSGTMKGMNSEQFIWRKLKPLRELPPLEELDPEDSQLDLFGNECEGMCGV